MKGIPPATVDIVDFLELGFPRGCWNTGNLRQWLQRVRTHGLGLDIQYTPAEIQPFPSYDERFYALFVRLTRLSVEVDTQRWVYCRVFDFDCNGAPVRVRYNKDEDQLGSCIDYGVRRQIIHGFCSDEYTGDTEEAQFALRWRHEIVYGLTDKQYTVSTCDDSGKYEVGEALQIALYVACCQGDCTFYHSRLLLEQVLRHNYGPNSEQYEAIYPTTIPDRPIDPSLMWPGRKYSHDFRTDFPVNILAILKGAVDAIYTDYCAGLY